MNPIEALETYKSLIAQLPELIKKRGFRDNYVYESIKMSKGTYYRKLKDGSWTVQEVEAILSLF